MTAAVDFLGAIYKVVPLNGHGNNGRVFGNHSYNIVHVIPLFLFRCLRFACGKKDPFFPITGRTEFPISILSDLGKANLL